MNHIIYTQPHFTCNNGNNDHAIADLLIESFRLKKSTLVVLARRRPSKRPCFAFPTLPHPYYDRHIVIMAFADVAIAPPRSFFTEELH
jgi:hypothetical protein